VTSISTAISTGQMLMNKLASVSAANAAATSNSRLTLIGNDISNQLNQKIAQLQTQAQDPELTILQQQGTNITKQLTTYQNAETQIGQNNTVLAQLGLQLSDMAVAAQSGDASTFDQSLASAQNDVSLLQVVPFTQGLAQDGITPLKYQGLGLQSSSTYDLSTPAGQTAALNAVQAAQAQIKQIQAQSSLNQQITASIQTALNTQLTNINNQMGSLQQTELTDASNQIAQWKQQAQTEYHLIELQMGNSTTAASVLTSMQSEKNLAAVQPGTTLGIIDPTPGEPALFVANLTSPTPTTSSSSNSAPASLSLSSGSTSTTPATGSIISTTA
jgi:hypothetical protein